MSDRDDVRASVGAALGAGARGAPAASRLCVACLPLLVMDAAAISVIDHGASRGTFGASDDAARVLDELQFTCGEGPCLEAAREGRPVLVPDLQMCDESRWPGFREAAGRAGIRAVFALPVRVGAVGLGALDLFRRTPGPMSGAQVADAQVVAGAAAGTLLDLLEADASSGEAFAFSGGADVTEWARIEVYQATGMIMAQLGVSAIEALVRLRAYAFAHDLSASDAARLVIARDLVLEA